MSTTPKVASSPRYLRLFGVSVAVVVACLLGLLFLVRMEATISAPGLIKARDQREIRAPLSGLLEPGWFEGAVALPAGATIPFRIDSAGNGCTAPAEGVGEPIRGHALLSGPKVKDLPLRWHRLTPGDILHAGQPLVRLNCEPWRFLPDSLPAAPLPKQLDEQASVLTPPDRARWLVLKVPAEPGAVVRAGDLVALLAPVDPKTNQPTELIAELLIEERLCDEVKPGLNVRLNSTMFNHRLYGHAEGELEQLDPWGEAGPNGERRYRALVRITSSPFQFKLGSSVKADVILGRKLVYRIIMEH